MRLGAKGPACQHAHKLSLIYIWVSIRGLVVWMSSVPVCLFIYPANGYVTFTLGRPHFPIATYIVYYIWMYLRDPVRNLWTSRHTRLLCIFSLWPLSRLTYRRAFLNFFPSLGRIISRNCGLGLWEAVKIIKCFLRSKVTALSGPFHSEKGYAWCYSSVNYPSAEAAHFHNELAKGYGRVNPSLLGGKSGVRGKTATTHSPCPILFMTLSFTLFVRDFCLCFQLSWEFTEILFSFAGCVCGRIG